MLEAAMQLGRSCIAVDADGMLNDYLLLSICLFLAIQFAGASKRMAETYDSIIKHVAETHSGDLTGYVTIFYLHSKFRYHVLRAKRLLPDYLVAYNVSLYKTHIYSVFLNSRIDYIYISHL